MAKKKRPAAGRVKYQIILFVMVLMSMFGAGRYYNELKPLVNIGADYLTEWITRPPAISGNVAGVVDGDTVRVIGEDGGEIKIRLYGIDAPEIRQKYGAESYQALEKMIMGQNVVFLIYDVDQYGRSVGVLKMDEININEKMIAEGNAWCYSAYCKKSFCSRWKTLEAEAKIKKAGLWRYPNPTPPWEYRHN